MLFEIMVYTKGHETADYLWKGSNIIKKYTVLQTPKVQNQSQFINFLSPGQFFEYILTYIDVTCNSHGIIFYND